MSPENKSPRVKREGDDLGWVAVQVFPAFAWTTRSSRVVTMLTGTSLEAAWRAHLGGFLAGFLLVGLFERRV